MAITETCFHFWSAMPSPHRFPSPWSIEEGGSLAPLLLAKHSPAMLLAHFIGDARSRQPHQFSKRLCQGRTQRAKAGPGLFVHDAVSASPFLVIEIAPCGGHVTDAIVSPASQANLQFDVQLSCLTTCKPAPSGP
jgi:hypothetical protein